MTSRKEAIEYCLNIIERLEDERDQLIQDRVNLNVLQANEDETIHLIKSLKDYQQMTDVEYIQKSRDEAKRISQFQSKLHITKELPEEKKLLERDWQGNLYSVC